MCTDTAVVKKISKIPNNSPNIARKDSGKANIVGEIPACNNNVKKSKQTHSVVNNTVCDDKYTLGLLSIARKCDKLKRARTSAKNTLFRAQNHQMFGFIPLDGVPRPVNGKTKYPCMGPLEALEAHNILKRIVQIFKASKFQSIVA